LKNNYPDLIKTLIYAPHPAQKFLPDLETDERFLESKESPFEAAKIMAGMFSTLMIEAYLKGQNVVSVQCGLKTENKDILSRKRFSILIKNQNEIEIFKDAIKNIKCHSNSNFKKPFENSIKKIEKRLYELFRL
jgi:hypothetical protein